MPCTSMCLNVWCWCFFFFKQKTAYEIPKRDWSSDVCSSDLPPIFFQGAPRCHPQVTMRLETPVLYFHPTAAQTNFSAFDVKVQFHGGWLTQFYPDAESDPPKLQSDMAYWG